jgi:hypothetical protein
LKDLRFSRRWLWRMASSGMLGRVAFVRTDVSEELSASIRVTRIGELGTTIPVTSNRRTLRRNTKWRRHSVPTKHRFLQEPHGVTSQKTPLFISCLVSRVSFAAKTWFDCYGNCLESCWLATDFSSSAIADYGRA